MSPTFIVALLTISQDVEAICMSTVRGMDEENAVYIYTYIGVLFSLKKEKKILSSATTWMNLENIILSEMSQTQKDKYYVIQLI